MFENYDPKFVHIEIKYLSQVPDETPRHYLFSIINRATRWIYLEVRKRKAPQATKGFLNSQVAKAPFVVKKLPTDNDKTFTDA